MKSRDLEFQENSKKIEDAELIKVDRKNFEKEFRDFKNLGCLQKEPKCRDSIAKLFKILALNDKKVAIINAANINHPGGNFCFKKPKNGSQEINLANVTFGLYKSLIKHCEKCEEFEECQQCGKKNYFLYVYKTGILTKNILC
jgi:hypothetical protein